MLNIGPFHTKHLHLKDLTLKKEERKIALQGTMTGSFVLFTSVLSMFWVSYLHQSGYSGLQIGIVFAILQVSALISTFPGGFLNDIFKTKYLIILGLSLTIIQLIGGSIINNFALLVLLFFIGGLGKSIFNTSIDSLMYKSLNPLKKDQEIGLYLCIRYIILAVGSIILGFTLDKISFPLTLQIISTILFFFIILSKKLPDTKNQRVKISSYKKDIAQKKILLFLLTMFLFFLHFGTEIVTLTPYLQTAFQSSSTSSGLYIGISLFLMPYIILKYSKLPQEKKAKPSITFIKGLYFSAIGLLIMSFPNFTISFIGRLIHSIGDALVIVSIYHDISVFFPSKRIGGDSSLISLMLIMGSFLGSLIFGPLSTAVGYHNSIIISSIIGLLACFLAIYQTIIAKTEKESQSIICKQ